MRRFILAVQLMKHNLLDCNSAFMKAPYFQDDMTPRFRYCEDCRNEWRKSGRYPYVPNKKASELCTNDCRHNLNDPNGWNNKCTQTFYEAAEKFGADMGQVETLLHGNWLSQEQHLAMLARITFTSDLKWIFSIYAAQRFWDAAMVGCINVLPSRTMDQDYFPVMEPNVHYRVFGEDMASLRTDVAIDEAEYNSISKSAMALYNQWMRPSDYSINTNLLQKIFQDIKAIQ